MFLEENIGKNEAPQIRSLDSARDFGGGLTLCSRPPNTSTWVSPGAWVI